MGRTYIYRINYCMHWTKICVQKLKSFHWTGKSLWVSIERESNKGKEFDIGIKSNDLHVIWNNFKIDKPPYCTCVLLRDHFFILKQQLALDFFNSELHSKCSKYKYKSIMMEAFQHLRLSERHFRITETKEIWQQLDCSQFERLKNCRLHITIQQEW